MVDIKMDSTLMNPTATPKTASTFRFKASNDFWIKQVGFKTTNMPNVTGNIRDNDENNGEDDDDDFEDCIKTLKHVEPETSLLERDTWHTVVFNDNDLNLFSEENSRPSSYEKAKSTLDFKLNDGSDRVVKFEFCNESRLDVSSKNTPTFIQEIIQSYFREILLCIMIIFFMVFFPQMIQTHLSGIGFWLMLLIILCGLYKSFLLTRASINNRYRF